MAIPARDEESLLPAALDALAGSVDLRSKPLSPETFEVIVFLNNCRDSSAAAARSWGARHSAIRLHVVEGDLPPSDAHVGSARRALMDTAWRRLAGGRRAAILSTDADTRVAPDWIAQNLRALDGGADAVGGAIQIDADELATLPAGTRRAVARDAHYQCLVAELEHWLDPQMGDPWPRHLQHFGASLACTPDIYARAGGLPPERSLEDIAFANRLGRVDARLRHAPEVRVSSSARFDGRVGRGLSSQLREWQQRSDRGEAQRVLSCAWLVHRFQELRRLRLLWRNPSEAALSGYPVLWRERLRAAALAETQEGEFLVQSDADPLLRAMFRGDRFGEIEEVNRQLEQTLGSLREQPLSPVNETAKAGD